MSDNLHAAAIIAVISLVTIALRGLPFLIFGGKRQVPKAVLYLGDVLPSAALGMLVVYCLKDLNFTAAPYGLLEIGACAVVVLVQAWKRNTIWSILAGTLAYMLLIQIF